MKTCHFGNWSGLVTVISGNAVHAAPAGLDAVISSATATLAGTTLSTSTLTKGILLMASTKQKAAIASIALFLVIGGTTAIVLNRASQEARAPSPGSVEARSSLQRESSQITITASDLKSGVTNGDKIDVKVQGGTMSITKPN